MKSPQQLQELLSYDPETGRLFWRDVGSPQRRAKYAGKEAFTADDGKGYLQGRISGHQYKAHRVVWAVAYGAYPNGVIDHKNGVKSDNRLQNLRDATPSQNSANRKSIRGASRFLGVCYHKKAQKWVAGFQKDGMQNYLGLFNCEAAAAIAYAKAAREAHGEFCGV